MQFAVSNLTEARRTARRCEGIRIKKFLLKFLKQSCKVKKDEHSFIEQANKVLAFVRQASREAVSAQEEAHSVSDTR